MVTKSFGFVRGKPGVPEREAAMYVAKAVTGKTYREIRNFFGIERSAVSEIVSTVEKRGGQEERFRWEIVTFKDSLVK